MGCVIEVEIDRRQEKETLISDKKWHDDVDNMRIVLCGHGFLNEWVEWLVPSCNIRSTLPPSLSI